MDSDQSEKSQGEKLLGLAWFAALSELADIVTEAESTTDRIAAADTLLRYFISLGQSINNPYVPEDSLYEEDDDDE